LCLSVCLSISKIYHKLPTFGQLNFSPSPLLVIDVCPHYVLYLAVKGHNSTSPGYQVLDTFRLELAAHPREMGTRLAGQ